MIIFYWEKPWEFSKLLVVWCGAGKKHRLGVPNLQMNPQVAPCWMFIPYFRWHKRVILRALQVENAPDPCRRGGVWLVVHAQEKYEKRKLTMMHVCWKSLGFVGLCRAIYLYDFVWCCMILQISMTFCYEWTSATQRILWPSCPHLYHFVSHVVTMKLPSNPLKWY